VAPEKLARFDECVEAVGKLAADGLLRGSVGGRVALLFFAEAEPQQNAESIGIGCEERITAREEENLFGARLPDPGELPKSLLRLGEGASDDLPEIASEILQRDSRARVELLSELLGQDSVPSHPQQFGARRGEDLLRLRADRPAERLERLFPPLVVGEIGDVLPEDLLERIGNMGPSRRPVEVPQFGQDPRERRGI